MDAGETGAEPRGVTMAVGAPARRPASPPAAGPAGGARGISPGFAPPASVPLGFLVAGATGLTALGLALVNVAPTVVVAPTDPHVIATVHLGVLAFLTVSVLGAVHQFGPVVGVSPLRSVPLARITFACVTAGAWLLPLGFVTDVNPLVELGGVLVVTAVVLAGLNLLGPLRSGSGGVPLRGLRWSVPLLLLTTLFGIVYAVDRDSGWFALLGHRVLAHAHLGLLGWVGLTYVSVAEKLWPMFLLAHRPSDRAGRLAVQVLPPGVLLLATGLLFAWPAVAALGGLVAAAGLGAHLASLGGFLRHRRRRLELLHAFVLAAATALVAAVTLGAFAGLADVSSLTRVRLVSAEIAALVAWVGLAIVGHSHKIVPFISWTALRMQGRERKADGRPLLFADLYDGRVARLTFALVVAGFASLVAGLAWGNPAAVRGAGLLLAATGIVTALNLGFGPRRAVARGARAPSAPSPAAGPSARNSQTSEVPS